MRTFALFSAAAALLSTIVPTALAQTFTDCNPLERDGCPHMPALGTNATFFFNKTSTANSKVWNETMGDLIDWAEKGTTFTITHSGDAPTIKSNFYIFFGRVSVVMKAAKGRGIISSFILQSEDLDEVDWEFLGSNNTHVLTNYFGKGNTTDFTRGKDYPSPPPQEGFHNYTIDWTRERIEWWMDDKLLRTLKYEEALGGKNYPQTPMTVRMGSWSGGDKTKNDPGVVEWAGGETNFKEAPFIMTVAEVHIQDYTSGKEYQWGDRSGSWQSIKVIEGKSKAIEEIQKPHGVRNRWSALSKTVQIIIICSIIGFVVICACLIAFCCIRQRRAGRKEWAAHEAEMNKEAAELLEYKRQMAQGKFGQGSHQNRF